MWVKLTLSKGWCAFFFFSLQLDQVRHSSCTWRVLYPYCFANFLSVIITESLWLSCKKLTASCELALNASWSLKTVKSMWIDPFLSVIFSFQYLLWCASSFLGCVLLYLICRGQSERRKCCNAMWCVRLLSYLLRHNSLTEAAFVLPTKVMQALSLEWNATNKELVGWHPPVLQETSLSVTHKDSRYKSKGLFKFKPTIKMTTLTATLPLWQIVLWMAQNCRYMCTRQNRILQNRHGLCGDHQN